MSVDELREYIRTMLGESYVDVELTDEDIHIIVQQALAKVAPYYDGRRFILGQGPVIDLSDHSNIKEIVNVYNTKNVNLYSMKEYVFGGSDILIYSATIMDRMELYNCYKMLYNELNNLKGIGFRYIKPTLYVDGYNDNVLIEALVRPESLYDIDRSSEYFAWVKDYCLALAKEVVGRTRSKFTVTGSPYQLDGERLISEATQSKQELEAQLIGSIFIL